MGRLLKLLISAFLLVNILSSVRGLSQIHILSKILTVLFIALIAFEFYKGRIKLEKKYLQFLILLLLFPVWALITSLWSIRPDISALASVNYIVMVIVFFGLGYLWKTYKSNENFLALFLPANLMVLTLAFISIITGIPEDSWSGGHGRGLMSFFGHQNSLAMAVLLTMPGLFSLVIGEQRSVNSKGHIKMYFFWLLITANCLLITLTYSRAAMMALFVGAVIYLFLNKKFKVLKLGFAVIAVFTLLAVTVKPLNTTVYKLLAKHDMSVFATRQILWGPSWEAAKNNFVSGAGYTMTDQSVKILPGTGSGFNKTTGLFYREKGNSYLALIEETGIIGLIFFVIPIIYLLMQFNKSNNANTKIFLSLIIAFLFQALFEEWFYGSGWGFRLFLLFIIFSYFNNQDYKKTELSLQPKF